MKKIDNAAKQQTYYSVYFFSVCSFETILVTFLNIIEIFYVTHPFGYFF